ncbi:pyridoxamine 5'-phosphate oxidase family protein [Candidatus Xianfuyuplasma coldseepsis]|uniref:HugZ family protein n=1 Tax=Candidatus Xianfuyuplasma coldseepsis TaxID=2782163 RepID=A0A7L7KS33_9MOLU|nr:pyridoxamine 5'-phosphate oxidase family protein [Xianfuyuplasma coldseepsis]QMS84608.1 HugZ family protein [Xianfuyuplasma coldseepsis]
MATTLENIQLLLEQFPSLFQSVTIASIKDQKTPYSSYAPFVMANSTIYILISTIAQHYKNIVDNPTINIMMIEDEKSTKNIFFRRRLSYLTSCQKVDDKHIADLFIDKFGEMAELLFSMDFVMMECTIINGNFIVGPGQAYHIDQENQVHKQMTGTGGHGHRKS